MFASFNTLLHELIFGQPGVFFNAKKDDIDYSSGALQIKGLKYEGRTNSAAEHFEYGLRGGTTLKNLIDVADNLKMVGFSFQLYNNRWQGCRDYMYCLQCLLSS